MSEWRIPSSFDLTSIKCGNDILMLQVLGTNLLLCVHDVSQIFFDRDVSLMFFDQRVLQILVYESVKLLA
jgi:hypothetical protein